MEDTDGEGDQQRRRQDHRERRRLIVDDDNSDEEERSSQLLLLQRIPTSAVVTDDDPLGARGTTSESARLLAEDDDEAAGRGRGRGRGGGRHLLRHRGVPAGGEDEAEAEAEDVEEMDRRLALSMQRAEEAAALPRGGRGAEGGGAEEGGGEDQQALLDYAWATLAAQQFELEDAEEEEEAERRRQAAAAAAAGGGGSDGGGAAPPAAAREGSVMDNPNFRRRLLLNVWKKANGVLVLYLLPVTIGLIVILTLDWGASCEKPLQIWATVQMVIQLSLLGTSVTVVLSSPKPDASDEEVAVVYRRMYMYYLINRSLDMAWLSWFIIGMVWTFGVGGKECPNTAPYLFRGCLTLLTIQIVLLTVAFMLCCCIGCSVSLRLVFAPVLVGMAPSAPPGASKKMINKLQMVKFSDELGIDSDHRSCAICLSDYEEGQGIRFLPCQHHFHADCVDKWLRTNKSCPFCKQCIDREPSPSSFTSASSSSSSGPSIASSSPLRDIEAGL